MNRRWMLILAVVFLVAIALRVAAALSIWQLPSQYLLNADAWEYHHNALIMAGHEEGSLPKVFRLSPGTTLWGAGLHSIFGPSHWAVLIPQILLGALAAVVVAIATRSLSGDLAGAAAGLLLACCEPLLIYDSSILPTGPAVFLVSLLLWQGLRTAAVPGWRRTIGLGLLLGVAILFRPNLALIGLALVPLLLSWWKLRPLRIRLTAVAAFLLFTALPVIPITATNWIRGEVFVPVTSSAGINLFIGNHQGSTGRLNSVFGEHSAAEAYTRFTRLAEKRSGRPLNDTEVSAFWSHHALEEVKNDPARFVALLGKKALYGLNGFETPDNVDPAFLEKTVPFLRFPFPGFALLLVLGSIGLIRLWRDPAPGTRTLHSVAATVLLTMIIFFVSGRYRAPILPVLAIGAGCCLEQFRQTIIEFRTSEEAKKRHSVTSLAIAALFAAALATLTSLPILHPSHETEWARLADAHMKDGSREGAEKALRSLIETARAKGDRQLMQWGHNRLLQLASDSASK